MRFIASLLVVAAAAVAGLPAAAQTYPSRPIRVMVPFSPGGASDTAARIVGQKLAERFGRQVVVENRPGAGGTIGTELAARAAPDGYNLLMGSSTEIAIDPHLYRKLTYDTVKLRALAVTSPTRRSAVPDLPTAIEAGVPGYEILIWNALFAPRATPVETVARLNAEVVRILDQPDMRDAFAKQGAEVSTGTPAQLAAHAAAELAKRSKVVAASGARLD